MNRFIVLIFAGLLGTATGFSQAAKHIGSKEFAELSSSGNGIILDVRTSQEYSQGHIENSTLISVNDPKFVEKVSLLQRDKPIYVYCLTGSRSYAVANFLSRNGYTRVYNLTRGILEWQRYGYKITRSKNPVATNHKTYSQQEFQKILTSNSVVLVDFHATWCAPCKKMSPVIDRIRSDYYQKAAVEKIEITANKELQKSQNIANIPGFVIYKNGKEVWRHSGIISYEELSNTLEQYL